MLIAAVLAVMLQAAPPVPIDCTDANHAAFNFWVGDWDVVVTGTDTVVAHSVISPAASGCAIEENYHQTIGQGGGAMDYRGASFSTFDQRGGGVWRQFYVDSGGGVTMFEGGLRDGAMVLEFQPPRGGKQRMTVAPQPDGTVRQYGEASSDNGVTWVSGGYDFTYRRR